VSGWRYFVVGLGLGAAGVAAAVWARSRRHHYVCMLDAPELPEVLSRCSSHSVSMMGPILRPGCTAVVAYAQNAGVECMPVITLDEVMAAGKEDEVLGLAKKLASLNVGAVSVLIQSQDLIGKPSAVDFVRSIPQYVIRLGPWVKPDSQVNLMPGNPEHAWAPVISVPTSSATTAYDVASQLSSVCPPGVDYRSCIDWTPGYAEGAHGGWSASGDVDSVMRIFKRWPESGWWRYETTGRPITGASPADAAEAKRQKEEGLRSGVIWHLAEAYR